MEPDDGLDLATGDIVLAKTGEDPSDWTGIAIVIKSRDLGTSHARPPVVLTSDARVGEIGSALPSFSDDDLVIVAGEHERPDELLDQLKSLIRAGVEPADETGAALIHELGGGVPTRSASPEVMGSGRSRDLSRFLASARTESALSYRRCPWGDPMPCQHSLGRPR
jgi:hypothetical protein